MAEEREATKLAETMEGGRGAPKSNDILATPMRKAVTPNDKQQSKREQDAPEKIAISYEEGPKKLFWSRQEITYPFNGRKPNHDGSTKT